MKSTLVNNQTKQLEISYPCLRQSSNCGNPDKIGPVVLFTSLKEGTVVHSGNSVWALGYYSTSWVSATDLFTWNEYVGEIELSN